MKQDEFQIGRLGRFFKLGSLSGIISASYLGHKARSYISTPTKSAENLRQKHIKNAERIAKTFGQLKGAVMKVGQMMSLQAGIFPEEFTSVLSSLQQDSPPIPYEVIERQVVKELGAPISTLFKSFDQQAFASASIGQVHRAELPDGEQVVVKVQYPNVADMVESDLKNLRMFFRSLAKYKLNMDALELWAEIRERLNEELNYEIEIQNIYDFRECFHDDNRIIIPEPVPEYSTRHVLTLEFIEGLSWREITSDTFSASIRNNLAQLLFETLLKQLFHYRLLHADPNLSNFAFREEGKLILYDFGCVKRFTPSFITHYRQMVIDAINHDFHSVILNLNNLGFHWSPPEAIDEHLVQQCVQIILRPYLVEELYDFGQSTLHIELFDIVKDHMKDQVKFVIPPDIVFLDRVVGGMYGNMMKLKASGSWKEILLNIISASE